MWWLAAAARSLVHCGTSTAVRPRFSHGVVVMVVYKFGISLILHVVLFNLFS